eukprot:EG_transcript_20125
MHGIVFARLLQADFQLPPLMFHRETNVTFRRMRFVEGPLSDVLDVAAMQVSVGKLGVQLLAANATGPVCTVHFRVWFMQSMKVWVQKAEKALLASLSTLPPTCRRIRLQYWPAYARVGPLGWLFRKVLSTFAFAAPVRRTAARTVARLRAGGGGYAGVHLRIEQDFINHPFGDPVHEKKCKRNGAAGCLRRLYLPALKAALHNASQPMYLASGIFENEPAVKEVALSLLRPYASRLAYNAIELTAEERANFTQEQLAANDLLVMIASDRFVGMPSSSFSCFVREYRAARGLGGETAFVRAPSKETLLAWTFT